MENKAKIRINLDTREFEIEGTEEFVNSHTDKIEGFFGTVKQIASGRSSAKAGKASSKRGRKPSAKAAAPVAAKEVKAAAAPAAKAGRRGRPAKAVVKSAAKPVAAKEVKAAAPAAKPAKAGKRGRPAKVAKPVAKPVAAKEVKAATPAAKPAKVVKAKVAKAPKAKVVKAPKVKAVKAPKAPKAPKVAKAKKAASAPKVEVKVTPEFIAFFKRVPKEAKDIDKMLAASLFVQNASGGTQFTAKEVNALLVSQGVKLSNAAQYVKNSIKTNRMAQLDRGKFKLTPEGIAHVNSVLTK